MSMFVNRSVQQEFSVFLAKDGGKRGRHGSACSGQSTADRAPPSPVIEADPSRNGSRSVFSTSRRFPTLPESCKTQAKRHQDASIHSRLSTSPCRSRRQTIVFSRDNNVLANIDQTVYVHAPSTSWSSHYRISNERLQTGQQTRMLPYFQRRLGNERETVA